MGEKQNGNCFQLREVYTKAVYVSNLTESAEYEECMKLLKVLSKEELFSKLESIVKIVGKSKDPKIKEMQARLEAHVKTIRDAILSSTGETSEIISTTKENLKKLAENRKQLKEVYIKSKKMINKIYVTNNERKKIKTLQKMKIVDLKNTNNFNVLFVETA